MSDTAPTLGRYIIERRIASGGMADVYLARHEGSYGFVKRVALKVLKREIAGDRENVAMFVREAHVAAEFRHPNLAQVYEVGEVDGQLFIAMELVRGISVATLMRELGAHDKGMPMNVAVRIAIDTLDGLTHAHEAHGPDGRALGLVHRDISPQNVMVALDGVVKVVDFGIAHAENTIGRTREHSIKGKFNYMPPEQWDTAGGIDARADLFAVGVVLYEMTTGGMRLFQGETPKDLYRAVVLDEVPPPSTRVPEYPEGLSRIVMRALERGPAARWQSARAMRTALVEFAQGQGWSLTQKAVADTVRSAIGSGEIESRWQEVQPGDAGPIGGALADATRAEGRVSMVPEAPTRAERRSRPAEARGGEASRTGIGGRVALVLGAFLLGVLGGYGLFRSVSHERVLRVARAPGTAEIASRAWDIAHPERALTVSALPSDERCLHDVVAGTSDVALLDRTILPEELAEARDRGVVLVQVATGPGTFAVTRGPAVGTLRSFVDWVQTTR